MLGSYCSTRTTSLVAAAEPTVHTRGGRHTLTCISSPDLHRLRLGRWAAANRGRYSVQAKEVDVVRDAYFDDPTVSHEDYGRLIEDAAASDQVRELELEAATAREV